MAVFRFSALSDGQSLVFNPNADVRWSRPAPVPVPAGFPWPYISVERRVRRTGDQFPSDCWCSEFHSSDRRHRRRRDVQIL